MSENMNNNSDAKTQTFTHDNLRAGVQVNALGPVNLGGSREDVQTQPPRVNQSITTRNCVLGLQVNSGSGVTVSNDFNVPQTTSSGSGEEQRPRTQNDDDDADSSLPDLR